eukprot:5858981-Lingulodinium_polyedra.AAC.1
MQDMVAAFREVIRSEGLATKTDLARVHERMDQQEARLGVQEKHTQQLAETLQQLREEVQALREERGRL